MLVAFSGITGVGKSFYSEEISNKLNFHKVHTVRTRKMRPGEVNGVTGIFVSNDELEEMKANGEIVYDFEVFDGRYAYKKDEILSKENYVFEIYYTTIDDWKKIRPDIVTIYLLPKDINKSIEMTKQRNLTPEKEQERINDTLKQYNDFMNDKELQSKFDYVIYNNYDNDSKEEIFALIKKLNEKENDNE